MQGMIYFGLDISFNIGNFGHYFFYAFKAFSKRLVSLFFSLVSDLITSVTRINKKYLHIKFRHIKHSLKKEQTISDN